MRIDRASSNLAVLFVLAASISVHSSFENSPLIIARQAAKIDRLEIDPGENSVDTHTGSNFR